MKSLAAVLAFGVLPVAFSAPTLTVSDGITTVTVVDNDLGDANPAVGAVLVLSSVGGWNFNISSGVTKPLAGTALQPDMDILVNTFSTGAGTLTIQFSDDSYGPASGSFSAPIGGNINAGAGSSIAFSTFISSTNTKFSGAVLTPEQNFIASGPFRGSASGFAAVPGSFALTEKLVITHAAAGSSGADAALSFEGRRLTTYTMGGWGAKPSGNNPGQFLATNFAAVYPAGLNVGGGFKLNFTSARGIENFLPCGGTPAALKQSYINPTAKLGVLAGQVVALRLGVDFSDAEITASGLASATFTTGKFAGKTVGYVLALAESVLGGAALPSGCSYSDLSDACTLVNENYDEGGNAGHLLP